MLIEKYQLIDGLERAKEKQSSYRIDNKNNIIDTNEYFDSLRVIDFKNWHKYLFRINWSRYECSQGFIYLRGPINMIHENRGYFRENITASQNEYVEDIECMMSCDVFRMFVAKSCVDGLVLYKNDIHDKSIIPESDIRDAKQTLRYIDRFNLTPCDADFSLTEYLDGPKPLISMNEDEEKNILKEYQSVVLKDVGISKYKKKLLKTPTEYYDYNYPTKYASIPAYFVKLKIFNGMEVQYPTITISSDDIKNASITIPSGELDKCAITIDKDTNIDVMTKEKFNKKLLM